MSTNKSIRMDWSKAGLCWHPAQENINIRRLQVIGSSPVRLELAGGWSDTPPYCQDLGGNVLNAAISIDGKKPVSVTISKLNYSFIEISVGDCGVGVGDMETLLDYTDLKSPFSIVKAAVIGSGLIEHDESADLGKILRSSGGGIQISLDVSLPYGSGLGVSSIIVYTIISCISEMFGFNYCVDELSNRTIYAEQLMGTVGGWQDQLGGCIRGLKLITTKPGLYQKALIHQLPVDEKFWSSFLLYYTGYNRLAKNILGDIMVSYNPYLSSSMETLIKHNEYLAQQMYTALQEQNYSFFRSLLEQVWRLHKKLHPQISTERTEKIEKSISELTQTRRILGAGNGGFMLIMAKETSDIPVIKRTVEEKCPERDAKFVDFAIDEEGLQLEVSS